MDNSKLHKRLPALDMRTTLVALEPVETGHAAALESALMEGEPGREIWRCPHLPMPQPGRMKQQIEEWQSLFRLQGAQSWVIRWLAAPEQQQIVGITRLFARHPAHRRAQIGGTWLVPRAQRQGINRHAKWLLLRHAFEGLQLERLEFVVLPGNEASMQALQAIGAEREGLLRSYVRLNEQMRDVWMFGLTRQDWHTHPFRTSLFNPLQESE